MADPTFVYESNAMLHALFGTMGIVGGAAALGTIISPKIAARVLPKPKETRLAEFLPFNRILPDGETVLCKGNTLTKYVGVAGIDQNFLTQEEIENLIQVRSNLYDSLSEKNVTLRIFTIRKPMSLHLPKTYPNPIVEHISKRWDRQFEFSFRTRCIISISSKGTQISDSENLAEARNIIMSILNQFGVGKITEDPATSPWNDTTISSFLGEIISPITLPRPKDAGEHLNDVLVADEVAFLKDGRIRFRNGQKEKYAVNIGIKKLGDHVSTALTNRLTAMPHETIIVQSVTPVNKVKAMLKLKQNQLMMRSGSFGSEQVNGQYQAMIEMIEGSADEKSTLCLFCQNIFMFADTQEKLTQAEEECIDILNGVQATPIIEKGATQASWFSQFPTYDNNPREYRLMSQNIAMTATFDTPPEGRWKSDWGPNPITLFHTGSNTTYAFQFHESEDSKALGHGVCIAGTGRGKTVFMEFLSCMASRNKKIKHFFFDRHKGTYVYTTAMGGSYIGLNAKKYTQSLSGGMNPFLMEDSPENRNFIKIWLQALTELPVTDTDAAYQCTSAVDRAFDMISPEHRKLSTFHGSFFEAGSEVSKRLLPWIDPDGHGEIFNSDEDNLDMDKSWLTTFDMTNLMDDQKLAGPSVLYIMHRIQQVIIKNKCPCFIFIDETEPMLRNELFRKIYLQMLQEFRKLGAIVISVFQRSEALDANNITEALTANSATFYLFPNPSGKASAYEKFNLTEREMNFVLGASSGIRAGGRQLLIKRARTKESVIVDIDLQPTMGPLLNIFKSGLDDAALASDLQRQWGGQWVQKYIEESAKPKE